MDSTKGHITEDPVETSPLASLEQQEYDRLPPYAWSALPSPSCIRLLTELQCDETADWTLDYCGGKHRIPKMTCSIRIVDLQDNPQYDCLSYTWGNPHRVLASKELYDSIDEYYSQRVPILCDSKVLWIGQNLAVFLTKAITLHETDRSAVFVKASGVDFSGCLWIDALCIDQEND
ncbi:hypothetical protein LTR85_009163 [Meristemomyces frigidus]|nr:hypothetical protein LTR85_009163 [Meristemomyces frigidus]